MKMGLIFLGLLSLCFYEFNRAAAPQNDLTDAEWATIREREEQDRALREIEEQELAEAIRRSALPAAQPQPPKRVDQSLLEPLSTGDMEAGFGATYSSVSGDDFARLHEQGHCIERPFLLHVFLGSLFQYYTHRFLGFDMTYNYNSSIYGDAANGRDADKFFESFFCPLPCCRFKCKFVSRGFGRNYEARDIFRPHIPSLVRAIDMLKKNDLLQRLGVAYQRQKIVVEKLHIAFDKAVQEKLSPADIKLKYDTLLRHDRYAIDLQTMIYHFMFQAYTSYVTMVMQRVGVLSKDNKIDFPPADFLVTFRPSFVDDPYYAPIIAKLEELSEPMVGLCS